MAQPETQKIIPTSRVNVLTKHLGLGQLSVKAIKDMGFSPVFQIDDGRGGCYWSPSIVSEIESYVDSKRIKSPKQRNQIPEQEFYNLFELIGNDVSTIKSMIEDLTKQVKETKENQYDLLDIFNRDSAVLEKFTDKIIQLIERKK